MRNRKHGGQIIGNALRLQHKIFDTAFVKLDPPRPFFSWERAAQAKSCSHARFTSSRREQVPLVTVNQRAA